MKRYLIALAIAMGLCSAAQAEVPAACQDMLPYGEPTWTGPALQLATVCHTGYIAAVDTDRLVPAWVAWHLTPEHVVGACQKRTDAFKADPSLTGRRATPADYARTGYDKGHLSPFEDNAWSATAGAESFYMSNMSPQAPGLNREEWERLEEAARDWTQAVGDLLVADGPLYEGEPAHIGADGVAVPVAFWKVVYSPSRGEALAFIMQNIAIAKGPLAPYQVTVAEVEHAAGLTLALPGVDKAAQPALWPDAGKPPKACPAP
ncbi:DNA/RNA non-specific endonuclease [Nitrospirillum amazonense]|uniref:DNA/RNA non-specific endonuclease n=1 Tax=Nitrospirillum amazonense TaxID=28077 RepID=UPI002DD43CF8|nr:DNA/RNA non-specific endonuclease [Nitrospirillum amazonense]MEC4591583.1 DNA/RNA non-specific endonuclease [Nitrospirillum amazonense]